VAPRDNIAVSPDAASPQTAVAITPHAARKFGTSGITAGTARKSVDPASIIKRGLARGVTLARMMPLIEPRGSAAVSTPALAAGRRNASRVSGAIRAA